MQDQNRVGRGERHHRRDDGPQAVRHTVVVHDVDERDDQERRRQHVGQQREVA